MLIPLLSYAAALEARCIHTAIGKKSGSRFILPDFCPLLTIPKHKVTNRKK
jgi:hypothetical protein